MAQPYNRFPGVFAKQPASSAFWVLIAPIIFPVLAVTLFGPVFDAVLQPPAQDLSAAWATLCFAGALHFGALSFWSRSIGAGGLAGPTDLAYPWLIRALWLGPLCLLIPSFGVAQLFPDQTGWQFADDVDPSVFEPENWALGFLLYAVLIAPVLEEVTFRGVALSALQGCGVPLPLAMILSSLAFAAIHLQYSFAALIVVFLAGFGFCLLRIASGSMVVVIVAHAAANAAMLFLQSI